MRCQTKTAPRRFKPWANAARFYQKLARAYWKSTGLELKLIFARGNDNFCVVAGRTRNPLCHALSHGGTPGRQCQIEILSAIRAGREESLHLFHCFAGLDSAVMALEEPATQADFFLLAGRVWIRDRAVTNAQLLEALQPALGKKRCSSLLGKMNGLQRQSFESAIEILSLCKTYLRERLELETLRSCLTGDAFVARAMAFLQNHYQENGIGLRQVAEHCGVSCAHLSRRFKESTGQGISACLAQLRIAHAKSLLTQTHTPIAMIAFESGFGSLSQFNRAFLKHCGVTPTQLRIEADHPGQTTGGCGGSHLPVISPGNQHEMHSDSALDAEP